jgi:hypothetical protein
MTVTQPNPAHPAPVEVFRSNDPGRLMIAKSLLDDADIEYAVPNEPLQNLFPGGYSASTVTPYIIVRAEDADAAREILKPLDGPA